MLVFIRADPVQPVSKSPSHCRLTCAYLSCKVDEFNVSSTQFVGNLVQEEQERVLEQILEFELLLIQQLHFHLVVHNPYRPMEGLLIDIKVGGAPGSFSCHVWEHTPSRLLI